MSWPTPVADVQVSTLNHRDRGGCHLFDSLRHTSWRQIIIPRGVASFQPVLSLMWVTSNGRTRIRDKQVAVAKTSVCR